MRIYIKPPGDSKRRILICLTAKSDTRYLIWCVTHLPSHIWFLYLILI